MHMTREALTYKIGTLLYRGDPYHYFPKSDMQHPAEVSLHAKLVFPELAQKWEKTLASGEQATHLETKDFHEIVALGKGAIPLVVQKLRSGHSFWYRALEEITGERLEQEKVGDFGTYHEGESKSQWHNRVFMGYKIAWIEWAKEKGYITPARRNSY